jgi:hypothetical protein
MEIADIPVAAAEVLASLRAARPTAQLFDVGDGAARMIASVERHGCLVVYIGECTPQQKLELFAEIKARDAAEAITSLLIDFSQFTGIIDWDYARAQENAAPGLEPPPSQVAYVVGNEIAGLSAKAILSHSRQQWRVFTARDDATAWLGWNDAAT